ncbi:MAG: AEC family transporter [Oscillospiraceae bacterium]|nr:AEC family transporter [Oscillospiraceae bacterium]
MVAVKLAIQLILMVSVGIFIGRAHIVKEDFSQQLTSLVMKICLPCLIVKSMMGAFSVEALKNSGRLVLLAILLWATTFALGQIVYHATGKTASSRIMRFSMIYTNFTFVGIPVVEALYGEMGVFYFVIFLVPYRMVYYSSSEPMLSPPGHVQQKRTLKAKLKGWFSPPVVAVFIGLFFYLTQISLPSPVAGVINSLGSCASPLGMLLCGISLSKYEFKRLLRPGYLLYPLVRNFIMPAVFLLVSVLLHLDRELAQVVVIFGALPTASLLAAFTIQYDPDQETQFEAAAAVLLSTAFCAFSIPLWANVLTWLFP